MSFGYSFIGLLSVYSTSVIPTVEFFDRDENSSGGLTGNLSDNPQKVNGLAGITLGS